MHCHRNSKIVFANAFAIRASDNDVAIDFSTEQNLNNTDSFLSSCQVVVTPKSAKLLTLILSEAIKQLEEVMGQIVIDQSRLDQIKGAIVRKTNNPPNS